MANEPNITITGNLTADPELKHTQNGTAVTKFTIASTPSKFDKQTRGWVDGETLFLRCTLWREYAENVAASLTKGTRVVATGKLTQHSYETREGEKRVTVELDVEEIGPALRYTTVTLTRTKQQPGNNSNQPWNTSTFDDTPF